jgi:hypothetical protein
MGSVAVAPRRGFKVILRSARKCAATPLAWVVFLAMVAAVTILIFRFGWLPM